MKTSLLYNHLNELVSIFFKQANHLSNRLKRKLSPLSKQAKQSKNFLDLISSIVVVFTQVAWSKISNSKILSVFLLITLFAIGTVVWNQASDYYKSLALAILQNQRVARENQQLLEEKLQFWQKAAWLQPRSEVLNSEIKTLLPSPN